MIELNSIIMTSRKYFNKEVKALDSPHMEHVVKETDDKYRADRDAPLPTGEPIDKLTEEEKL
jgi:hypothetical protein